MYSSRREIDIFRVRGYGETKDLMFDRIPRLQDYEFGDREGEQPESDLSAARSTLNALRDLEFYFINMPFC